MNNATADKKVIWVRGNTIHLVIPLEKETRMVDSVVTAPYYPQEGASITVKLTGAYKTHSFVPTLSGNLLYLDAPSTLSNGKYGVAVEVLNPDGTSLRSNWKYQVMVTESNDGVLEEWNDFTQPDEQLSAAVFFFAKGDQGDKGDPFTYADFTPEEIADLQRPALEAKRECEEWLNNHDVITIEEMEEVLG